jgi:hypothetical protein
MPPAGGQVIGNYPPVGGRSVYKNNVLQYILTDYGKFIPSGSNYTGEYNGSSS